MVSKACQWVVVDINLKCASASTAVRNSYTNDYYFCTSCLAAAAASIRSTAGKSHASCLARVCLLPGREFTDHIFLFPFFSLTTLADDHIATSAE